jgi:hypothetical protein
MNNERPLPDAADGWTTAKVVMNGHMKRWSYKMLTQVSS